MVWKCDLCLITFSAEVKYAQHVGLRHYAMSTRHARRVKEVGEAQQIWNNYHIKYGVMPTKPQLKKETQILPVDVPVIVPQSRKSATWNGTVPCGSAQCQRIVHPFLGGVKDHKIFEDIAYGIHGKANCKTTFTYVFSCIAHPLYKYDGKSCSQSGYNSLSTYISTKINSIRNLRVLFEAKFHGQQPPEAELVQVILLLRRLKAMEAGTAYFEIYGKNPSNDELKLFEKGIQQLKCTDSYLHFCRHDGHTAFLRIDVTGVYETKEEVNNGEKNMHKSSGSNHYWTGGTNLVDENTHNQSTEFRPPTAFCMVAPLDNLANLKLFMTENGIQESHHYKTTDLISDTKSKHQSFVLLDSSNITEDHILQEKIEFLMRDRENYSREDAVVDIEGLRRIDEKYSVKKIKLE